ncbi:MAG TPA: hypothetical protein VGK49_06835, partial [Ilumatobacteraceae bacterium]
TTGPSTLGITLTGVDWTARGFLVGHLVYIDDGNQAGDLAPLLSWRVEKIEGSTITLRGPQLPAAYTTAGFFTGRIFVAGQHGGLTMLHGGGNRLLNVDGRYDIDVNSIRRLDGLAWADDGYAVGDVIQVGNEPFTRTIIGFAGTLADCPFDDLYPGCGVGSIMLLSGPPMTTGTNVGSTIFTPRPFEARADASMDISVQSAVPPALPTTTLTRYDGGSFMADGFIVGMKVTISGFAGQFTIAAVTHTTLVLANAALPPTLTGLGSNPIRLVVVGYDTGRAAPGTGDQTMQVGGDRFVVCSSTAVDEGRPIPCGSVVGGPGSPLVIYGDTSQDGLWYSGDPSTSADGAELGDKPFNPFVNIPDDQNEDDEWFVGLANPFKRAGNDVIDASRLFADVVCTLTSCNLPTIGLTAYGGAGNDTIIGSQAGDHLAGGSGDDTIYGLRGVDHIYGDDGINVSILTRWLGIPSVNGSTRPNADTLAVGRDTLQGSGPGTIEGGPTTAYSDIVFGDHGLVVQDVEDTNLPLPKLQRIQTTNRVLLITTTVPEDPGDDTIIGGCGQDLLIGGPGNDMLDGACEDDLLFGDSVTLVRRVTYAVDSDTIISRDVSSLRFQALIGQVLYNRSDLDPALSGVAPANADDSGQLLVNNIPLPMRDNNLAWWADFQVLDLWHTFAIEDGLAAVGSFGNDYLAGGPEDDMIFGGLGNDVIMGDGSITSAVSGNSVVGASRSPDGCVSADTGLPGLETHAGTCDLVGDLDVVPTFEVQPKSNAQGEGDGWDYIEGGGGNDVIFGGLGQDDIIGGSSDFFSLTTPDKRPDGADIIFGDGGTHSDRNDNGDLAPGAAIPGSRHAIDADTIIGDNGRIVRIVGTKGVDICGTTCDPGEAWYVSYKYDDVYGPVGQLLVRGVTLLDYTPGGPDFRPDR